LRSKCAEQATGECEAIAECALAMFRHSASKSASVLRNKKTSARIAT
jgi:hypothetical protein